MIHSIKRLFILLSPQTKRLLPFVLFSILFIGILEMLSVALLMPLLANDQIGGKNGSVAGMGLNFIFIILNKLNINSLRDIAITVVSFMFIKHIIITVLNYFQYRIIFSNDIWLRNELLTKYTNYNYLNFSNLKSADLIRNTAEQVGQISYGSLLSILTIVSESVVVLVLLSLIFVTLPVSSTLLIVSVFLFGLLPFYIFKKRVLYLGKVRFESISKTINEIQNIYNLYVEIKLYDIKKYFLKRVKGQSEIFTNAQIQNNLIANLPKGIIEIAAVSVILILILNSKDDASFIPTIGIIVTSIFRIAPSFTRISSALTQLKYSVEQINVLHEVFALTIEAKYKNEKDSLGVKPIFKKQLHLSDIGFRYPGSHQLFSRFNLIIKPQEFLLLKGKSGKGKSTIVKVIMGLIEPDEGKIFLDGIEMNKIDLGEWYNKMGYVPQKPVIIEGTLQENICLGIAASDIDKDRYAIVIKDTQLSELKDQLGNNPLLQEGASISGGQAQRIGIARALYRNPEILFLDEPTSALDSNNASLINSLLQKLNKDLAYTIIIITHSNEFDQSATQIVEL